MSESVAMGLRETALVLSLGTAAIVLLAAGAARASWSARWRRTAWQGAILAILSLLAAEATGIGAMLVNVCRSAAPVQENPPVQQGLPAPAPQASAATAGPPPMPVAKSNPLSAVANVGLSQAFVGRSESIGDIRGQASTDRNVHPAGVRNVRPTGVEQADAVAHESRFAAGAALLWIAVAAVLMLRILWARAMLARFRRRHAAVEDQELLASMARLGRQLGLRRPVSAIEGSSVPAPVAFGILRPTVALPAGFARLRRDQQEAVLAHELAHLAGGDPFWILLVDLACVLLWWHPLVWWTRGRFRQASEWAADEASLLVPGGPDLLAECLVNLGRRQSDRRGLGWLAVEGWRFHSGLGRRVERLLRLRPRERRGQASRVSAGTALALVFLIPAVSCTAWARPQAEFSEGDAPMQDWLQRSWRHSLAAVVLAAVTTPIFGDARADDREGPERDHPREAARERGDREAGPRREADRERPGPREEARADRPEREGRRGDEAAAREREEMQRRFDELKRRSEEARAAGREEEAQQLKREAEEVMRRLERPQDRPRPDEGEMNRRFDHLRAAAENLHAAGMPDLARRVMQEAERMRGGRGPEGRGPEERPGMPGMPPGPPPERVERMEQTIQQLRGQVDMLRTQMEEMRKHLERLTDRVGRQ